MYYIIIISILSKCNNKGFPDIYPLKTLVKTALLWYTKAEKFINDTSSL